MCDPKSEGGRALRSYHFSMKLFLQNKHGNCCTIKTLCSIEFLNQDFFQIAQSWKLKKVMEALMLGRAIRKGGVSLEEE